MMTPVDKPLFKMNVNVTMAAKDSNKKAEKSAVKAETNQAVKVAKVNANANVHVTANASSTGDKNDHLYVPKKIEA
jgi:hypothetical protein